MLLGQVFVEDTMFKFENFPVTKIYLENNVLHPPESNILAPFMMSW